MAKKSSSKKVRISNSSVNCYGSRVLTEGIDYSQYERNPILLWMHKRGHVGDVIGTVENISVDGDDLVGELVFDGVGETAQMVAEKWEKGTLRMVSANFDIIELSDAPGHLLPGQKAYTVTRSKLMEVSVVDIGGNDDALPLVKLQKDGEEIELSSSGGGALPLLHDTQPTKKENKMNLQAIALKLGLPESATEKEILDAISVILGYKTENETLRAEVESVRLANIPTMVKGATVARKITADKENHFIELGKKVGVDSLKETFDSMSAVVKPTDITGRGVQLGSPAVVDGWNKLSDVPEDKMIELRANDKETYARLYKAEYGIDCEIEE